MLNEFEIMGDKVCIFIPHKSKATGVRTVHECFIDLKDLEKISQFNKKITYLKSGDGYAIFQWYEYDEKTGKKRAKVLTLHRFLMEPPPGMTVDHDDWDGLNNCRDNLKVCTYAENLSHRRFKVKKASPYRGVYPYNNGKSWRAAISINGKPKTIGYFKDEVEAAKAYDCEAALAFGEFAVLNFPTDKNLN